MIFVLWYVNKLNNIFLIHNCIKLICWYVILWIQCVDAFVGYLTNIIGTLHMITRIRAAIWHLHWPNRIDLRGAFRGIYPHSKYVPFYSWNVEFHIIFLYLMHILLKWCETLIGRHDSHDNLSHFDLYNASRYYYYYLLGYMEKLLWAPPHLQFSIFIRINLSILRTWFYNINIYNLKQLK